MYFLFAGETYYPMGGMQDLVGTFPTLESAREAGTGTDEDGMQYDWYQIAQLVDGQLVVVEGD